MSEARPPHSPGPVPPPPAGRTRAGSDADRRGQPWPGTEGQAPAAPPQEPVLSGRLHPAVLVLWPLPQLVPLVVLLLAGTISARLFSGVLLAVLAAGAARWLRFRWRVERGTFVMEQGLLARRVRTLPLERIQRVDVVRQLRHRLLGVTELVIEAIGSTQPEGKLDALAPADAERLRAALLARSSAAASPADSGRLLATTSGRRLLVAGLTGGRVGVAAALLGGVDQLAGDRWVRFLGELPARIGVRGTVAAAALLVAAAFVLSVAATVLAHWNFTLHRDGRQLVVRRGLLARRQETIPLPRLQAVRVEENLVRRWMGAAAVTADLAGGSGDAGGRNRGTLLPIGSRAEALSLAAAVLERHGLDQVALENSPPAARRRRWVRAGVGVLVITAPAVVLAGPVGWAAVLLAVPFGLAAEASYRALGRGRRGDLLLARSGLLVRRTSLVPVAHLHSLALTTTPLQRLAGLATLHLQIARSPGSGPGHRWVDLDAVAASTALTRLADELSRPRPTVRP